MDPLYRSTPDSSGTMQLNDHQVLYYEIRGSANQGKVVMVMGMFATSRYFDETADYLASRGFQVLTFHNRGIGKSVCSSTLPPLSIHMLAMDGIALVDHVWGKESSGVHLYGASMGGMIAQEMGVVLGEAGRLASLYLAVTSRGLDGHGRMYWSWLVTKSMVSWLVPWVYHKRNQPRHMMQRVMDHVFDPAEMKRKHPEDSRTYAELWLERWTAEYDEWFCFRHTDVTAAQIHIMLHHFPHKHKTQQLSALDVPKLVHVAVRDKLVPLADQLDVATAINADVVQFEGGHMIGALEEKKTYFNTLADHLTAAQARIDGCS